ncbi:AmmeMemoRadiSam system protein B [bacterium]|nr:AmmeMemoRadiSam system protein B [bacterium]
MEKIKEPSVANMFYSADFKVLAEQIKSFEAAKRNKYEYKTRAVISPHAGWIYSGQLAYEAISQLDKNVKNVIIFAPSHKMALEGLALTSYDKWATPFGNIDINQDVNNILKDKYNAEFLDEAYSKEHAVEVLVPFVQNLLGDVKIIPVLAGRENYQKIAAIIDEFYSNKDFGFIISSDLSHFLENKAAKEIDNKTADMIEAGEYNGFKYEQACGAVGIVGLVDFANQHNYSLIRINLKNSSAATGDTKSVVGYGAWFLYEGTKNQFIKEYYSDLVVDLCKKSIKSRLNSEQFQIHIDSVFEEKGACFVTLKKDGRLRGCIGSLLAFRSLAIDLISRAQDAAFRDSRFNPVTKEEFDSLETDVSILSPSKEIIFKDEQDLLDQIVPYKDGIIIRDGQYQAVYLPSVWEELPDKVEFLNSLKVKAGLSPFHFSPSFKAFRFETEYIK